MRELYINNTHGRFEDEPPIVRFLYERVILGGNQDDTVYGSDYIYDRVGRWVIWVDGVGFVHSVKYDTREDAKAALKDM